MYGQILLSAVQLADVRRDPWFESERVSWTGKACPCLVDNDSDDLKGIESKSRQDRVTAKQTFYSNLCSEVAREVVQAPSLGLGQGNCAVEV